MRREGGVRVNRTPMTRIDADPILVLPTKIRARPRHQRFIDDFFAASANWRHLYTIENRFNGDKDTCLKGSFSQCI
jgi:hypothetical protein